MPRTGQSETLFFTWLNGRFDLTKEPQAVFNTGTDANRIMTKAVAARFADGSPVNGCRNLDRNAASIGGSNGQRLAVSSARLKTVGSCRPWQCRSLWRLDSCQVLQAFWQAKLLIPQPPCLIYHDHILCVYVSDEIDTHTHSLACAATGVGSIVQRHLSKVAAISLNTQTNKKRKVESLLYIFHGF